MPVKRLVILSCLMVLCGACDGTQSGSAEGAGADATPLDLDAAPELPREWPTPPDVIGGDRPATYFVPESYTPQTEWPLVILLHGRSASGLLQDGLFQLSAEVDERGFLLVTPDGTEDDVGLPCWNATGTCCKADGQGEDDVAYLLGLIDEMGTYFRVDPRRVYLIGHSNGGFMSYRMACEAGERIAAIVSLAGMDWVGPSGCVPQHPVGVLHVHGTADEVIDIQGADGPAGPDPHYGDFPSAEASAAGWAERNGCGAPAPGPQMDLDSELPGAETSTTEWEGCEGSLRVALWSIEGGTHVPILFNGNFARAALEFLLSQSRPVLEQ